MTFALIAAVDSRGGIGKGGTLPWRLPEDLAYFQKVTKGSGKNAVIMGRATLESLPPRDAPLPRKALSGRLNIVLSTTLKFPFTDTPDSTALGSASSLEAALMTAEAKKCEKIFVIGGAKVFTEAIVHPQCRELFITEVEGAFDCDTFFPAIDAARFVKTASSEVHKYNGIQFSFVKYEARD